MTDETDKVTEHQTRPEDLRTSEIRYRRLFESARDGILLLDAASRRITDVNPFMVELMGYSRDEFLGKELWEIGLFKDKEQSRTAFQELQETGYIRYENMPLQTKAGELWNVEFISNVYREDGHRVIQCNIRDMTERKRAEEMRLWHSTIVESSNEGIVSFSFDGTVISWNRGAERIFGYAADEVIGQPISILAPLAGQLEQQDEILQKIERDGSVVGFETLCVRKDGELINISLTVSLIQDDNGRTLGVTAIVLDITERKHTEERLKQSEQWLRTIFETSHEGILVEDNERIHYVNKSYLRLFGYDDPEELIGRHISVVISPEDRERLLEFGRRRLRGEQPPSEYEFKGRRKDGSRVDVEASVAASQVGGSTYVTTMLRDITERKHAEILLDAQKQALEMVVGGSPLAEVLKYLAGIVEHQSGGSSIASILLLDEQGRLHNGAAPSLPEVYVKAIEGIEADESVGTCSAAAATRKTIISPDIAADPKWQDLKHLPLGLGFQAAWSLPIMAADERVLGTFGTYFREKRGPTKLERQTVEILAKTAALAIERKNAEEALLKLNEHLEGRVAERTVELTGMNASLQAEIVERQRVEHERASILRRLVMAQEEERRRIARDMHDQLGQQLTVLLLKLGMLKEDCDGQENLCGQVEGLERVAGQIDADVDFLVWELRPTVLDDLGLQDALTNFAQNWSKHFGIPVEVLTHGLGKESSTSEIDTVLYRIAQEALNNVAKHAGAANVTVLLEGRAGAVSLIIEDDGVGFDAENTSGANNEDLGLVGMRERAALVGGTAEVESHPGEGTRVIVRIPAPPAGAESRGA